LTIAARCYTREDNLHSPHPIPDAFLTRV